jgi:Raf kinase inhibitor-like YbhB/YbcL family protein
MKKFFIIIFILIIAGLGALVYLRYGGARTTSFSSPPPSGNPINTTTPMTISSPAFLDSQSIPKQYTCDGTGVNPPLQFSNLPDGTQSLALLVQDPDAPTGVWTHWLVWNMAATTTQISENSVPGGAVQGQGSSGQNVYGAPCPPVGTGPGGVHHYIFTVYALDSELTLPSYSTAQNLQSAMQGHIISQAQLVGLYGR